MRHAAPSELPERFIFGSPDALDNTQAETGFVSGWTTSLKRSASNDCNIALIDSLDVFPSGGFAITSKRSQSEVIQFGPPNTASGSTLYAVVINSIIVALRSSTLPPTTAPT